MSSHADTETMRSTLEVLASAAAAGCLSEGYDTPLTFGELCNVVEYALDHESVREDKE
jgi:hypothetical protein